SALLFFELLTIVGIGIYCTVHAYAIMSHAGMEGKPGLEIVESLDMFLVSLVFLMVSLGLMKLFYPDFSWFKKFDLPWLKIETFFDLKLLIWNAFLLTLLVTFGIQLIKSNGHWEWNMLVVPAAVLLFSVSAKIARH
ncbi:MAG TPA: YqhA family protein, partial [Chryseolinea sp.]|nr:YqhA family protein [Chryseolinea sp.]